MYNFKYQKVLISPNCIPATRTKNIFTPSANSNTFNTFSLEIGSIPFFLSSDKH